MSPSGGYRLGIDLGTTYTAAAVRDTGVVSMVGLGNRALQIPSVLFLSADGQFLVGEAAERRGLAEPDRIVREFKRRVGDQVPILVGGVPYSPQALTARLLRWVLDTTAERMGRRAGSVILTHPANWGPFKLDVLHQAGRLADLDRVQTCPEPLAAAARYASRNRVGPGQRVAVYDLGGGTFDVCVLQQGKDGFRLLGSPEGVEQLGGVDFDEALLHQVMSALDERFADLDPDDSEVVVGLARLHRDCVEAKEALSTDSDAVVPVNIPGITTSVRVTRTEFERSIRPSLQDTIDATRRALRSASVEAKDLSAILLVGGSSRIPLVAELLQREFGVPTAVDTHPKHDVAAGALLAVPEAVRTAPVPQPKRVSPGPVAPGPVRPGPVPPGSRSQGPVPPRQQAGMQAPPLRVPIGPGPGPMSRGPVPPMAGSRPPMTTGSVQRGRPPVGPGPGGPVLRPAMPPQTPRRPPKPRRRKGRLLAVVGIAALALMLIIVVVASLSNPPSDTAGPSSESSGPGSATGAADVAAGYNATTRAFDIDGLHLVLPGAPYTITRPSASILGGTGQGVDAEAVVHPDYNGGGDDSDASLVVDAVGSGVVGDEDLYAASDSVFRLITNSTWYGGAPTVRNEKKYTTTTNLPRPVRVITADVYYSLPGDATQYDVLTVLVAQGKSGGYVAMVSSEPDDSSAAVKQALQSSLKTVSLH